MSKGGGGGGGDRTVTREPFKEQKPFLLNVFEESQQAFNAAPRKRFKSDLVARPSQNQLAGLGGQLRAAEQFEQSGLADQTRQLSEQLAQSVQQGQAQQIAQQGSSQIPEVQAPQIGQAPDVEAQQVTAPSEQKGFPTLQEATEAAVQPIQENLQEEVLPQIESQAISQGAFGGSRQDLQQTQAVENFSKEASNAAAQRALQDLNQRRENQLAAQQANQQAGLTAQQADLSAFLDRATANQQAALTAQQANQQTALEDVLSQRQAGLEALGLRNKAAELAPKLANTAFQQSLAPSRIEQQVGAKERGFAQNLIDEQLSKFQQEQNLPFVGLDQLRSSVGNPVGTTTTTDPAEQSGLTQAIQSGLGGAAAGASIAGGISGLSGLTGSGIGAGLGILAGLSDPRLKEDVERIGSIRLNGGRIGLYKWRWIDTDQRDVGLMADEVQEVLPKATYETENGLLAVNYGEVMRHVAQ